MRPSATSTSAGASPCNGDPGSVTAMRTNRSRSIIPTLWIDEPALAISRDPVWAGATGKALSPNWNRTRCSATPSASAPTWLIAV
ncbi:hypothetical protein D806_009340 [Mycolicibacterium smegmatis MKD8]|uniref:Uncharacterized protein n=1 Tax=Mycolicibacterium smegmatis (strain MKD8) TaxID=1214915 RepID=A0A2U9PJJ9_MYCSE|nr:hypothetical protein D806_009340 [Mycolicibacterium smegmatis MKD8]